MQDYLEEIVSKISLFVGITPVPIEKIGSYAIITLFNKFVSIFFK